MGRLPAPHVVVSAAVLLLSLLQEDYSLVLGQKKCDECRRVDPLDSEYRVEGKQLETFLECYNNNCRPPCDSQSTQLMDSFQVRVEYTSIFKAYVITEWNTSSVSGPVHIEVEQGDDRVYFCLTDSTTSKLTVELFNTPLPPDYGCVAQNSNISVTVNGLQQTTEVKDCLSTHTETDICYPQVVATPANVSADVSSPSSGSVNVTFHWDPPTSVIDEYLLSIAGELVYLSGNVTEYTIRLSNVSSSDSRNLFLRIRAGVAMETNPCCTCITNGNIVFGPSATLNVSVHLDTETTTSPSSLSTGLSHAIGWPVALLVVLVAGIFITTFLRVFYIHRKNKLKENVSILTGDLDPDTVFLAASTEENAEVKRRIRHLGDILADNGLTPVYYEYVENDNSVDSPSALGINRWVELQFSRCEFVLFVCTKRFLEEWNGERKDILFPLVYPCRHLLDGSLTRPQNFSRFAVLFMGEERCVPPGLLRLNRFNIAHPKSDQLQSSKLMKHVTNKSLFRNSYYVNLFKHYC